MEPASLEASFSPSKQNKVTGRLWPGVAGGVWLRIPSGARMLCWKLYNLLPHCFSRALSTTLLCGRYGGRGSVLYLTLQPPWLLCPGLQALIWLQESFPNGIPFLQVAAPALGGYGVPCWSGLSAPSSLFLSTPSPKAACLLLLTSLRLHHFPQQCCFAITIAKPGGHCEFHIKFLYVVF